MKIKHLVIVTSVLALSSIAQETNDLRRTHDNAPRPEERRREGRGEKSPEQRADMQQRRLQLMERSLNKMGVSEEQRAKIHQLQKEHGETMRANAKEISEARKHLSKLQDAGASVEEIDAAIDVVTQKQAEQLKILVRNRMEMEKILGKEKFALFMDNARNQFRKHGRRGGSGMPPRPGVPPIPGQGDQDNKPPRPPTGLEDDAPPPPGTGEEPAPPPPEE